MKRRRRGAGQGLPLPVRLEANFSRKPNRSKKLYVLLGILVMACIAAFAVMQMEERKEQIKETGESILKLPGESAQSLFWEYNSESLSFRDEDENFPVSEEKINGRLEQFQSFGAAFIIENAEDFGQYRLAAPGCTINLSAQNHGCCRILPGRPFDIFALIHRSADM